MLFLCASIFAFSMSDSIDISMASFRCFATLILACILSLILAVLVFMLYMRCHIALYHVMMCAIMGASIHACCSSNLCTKPDENKNPSTPVYYPYPFYTGVID